MQLRDYQQEAVDTTVSFWENGVKNVLVVLPTGAGKCLGVDTPVMMFDGSIKKVQDVKVGDQLMGPDSNPRNVLSLARGRETLYRVNQVKGDSYVVNESHILSLAFHRFSDTYIKNLTVREYIEIENSSNHPLHGSLKGWKSLVRHGRVEFTDINVVKLDVGDYYGFEIDGDRLFLLGDFTVTHNTVVLSKLIENVLNTYPGSSICAIAHRQELVSQMSVTLARNGIVHRVIGPNSVVKLCTRRHMEKLGKSFYDPNSRVAVAGVDTLVRRTEQLESWLPTVKLWVCDESHHLTVKNKWGTSVEMFPNALGLGVTATPERADGKGLGRHADGYFDEMHVGPPMRELINRGYLTPYRIYAPPSTLNLDGVRVSKTTGDFNPNDINKAVSESSLVSHDKAIVGDVVAHYKRLAMGKLCVVFATDIKTSLEIAEDFNRNDIPAHALSSKSTDAERFEMLDKFERGELLVLVNVDLFGEGFDLPAIECVSMARPTNSYGLYVQTFGRALRLMEGKTEAIIIDHVGNVHRHGGPPDRPREWTLDRRERRSSSEPTEVQVRTCLNLECMSVYERFRVECPYCGTPIPPPAERSLPEFVDGDLLELTPDAMEQLYGAVNHNTQSVEDYAKELEAKRAPQIGIMAGVKRQREKLEVVEDLKNVMAQWCGIERANGLTDSEIYRKFYITFGTDVLTPQTWKTSEMIKMKERVEHAIA